MGTAQQPGLVPSPIPRSTAVEALDSKPEDLTLTLNSKQDLASHTFILDLRTISKKICITVGAVLSALEFP